MTAPLAISHRGYAPGGEENTLAAFQAAIDLGYDYLETDIRTTADGHAVIFHDDRLDRLTTGTGAVHSATLADLQGVRVAGEPLPTLDELFEAAAQWPGVRFNIDIKDAAGAPLLAEAILRHGMQDRVLIASFSDARRRACVRRYTELAGGSASAAALAQSPGMGLMAEFLVAVRARQTSRLRRRFAGLTALQVPLRQYGVPVVTPGLIRAAHELGIQVHVWTIDDEPTMHGLLDLGVDGIMTDRAEVLARVMRERGHWADA